MTNIHPTAIIHDGAQIDSTVKIGAYSIIGEHVKIAKDCEIHEHVVIDGRTELGESCEVFSFACLGKAPQHLRYEGEPSELIIGHHNIIREHVTMHIGTKLGNMKTILGNHGLYMASSHVAHDCVIGDHFIMAQNSALGGHCEVGDHVYFGAYAAAHQFVRIGYGAMIGGLTPVIADIIPFGNVYGERGHLKGINLIGMKRRGMEKQDIRTIKKAFEALFVKGGVLKENMVQVKEELGHIEAVKDIIEFIEQGGERPLCVVQNK